MINHDVIHGGPIVAFVSIVYVTQPRRLQQKSCTQTNDATVIISRTLVGARIVHKHRFNDLRWSLIMRACSYINLHSATPLCILAYPCFSRTRTLSRLPTFYTNRVTFSYFSFLRNISNSTSPILQKFAKAKQNLVDPSEIRKSRLTSHVRLWSMSNMQILIEFETHLSIYLWFHVVFSYYFAFERNDLYKYYSYPKD